MLRSQQILQEVLIILFLPSNLPHSLVTNNLLSNLQLHQAITTTNQFLNNPNNRILLTTTLHLQQPTSRRHYLQRLNSNSNSKPICSNRSGILRDEHPDREIAFPNQIISIYLTSSSSNSSMHLLLTPDKYLWLMR